MNSTATVVVHRIVNGYGSYNWHATATYEGITGTAHSGDIDIAISEAIDVIARKVDRHPASITPAEVTVETKIRKEDSDS